MPVIRRYSQNSGWRHREGAGRQALFEGQAEAAEAAACHGHPQAAQSPAAGRGRPAREGQLLSFLRDRDRLGAVSRVTVRKTASASATSPATWPVSPGWTNEMAEDEGVGAP